jgi:hypothetical protein
LSIIDLAKPRTSTILLADYLILSKVLSFNTDWGVLIIYDVKPTFMVLYCSYSALFSFMSDFYLILGLTAVDIMRASDGLSFV